MLGAAAMSEAVETGRPSERRAGRLRSPVEELGEGLEGGSAVLGGTSPVVDLEEEDGVAQEVLGRLPSESHGWTSLLLGLGLLQLERRVAEESEEIEGCEDPLPVVEEEGAAHFATQQLPDGRKEARERSVSGFFVPFS